MSTNYTVYIGPYVRCTVGRVDVQREIRSCVNAACTEHTRIVWSTDVQFCLRCGTTIGTVTMTETADAVDDRMVNEMVHDALVTTCGPGYRDWTREHGAHVWMANVPRDGLRNFVLEDRADFDLIDLAPDPVQAEIDAFRAAFADELTTLRGFYGATAVTVQWGIIQDYC